MAAAAGDAGEGDRAFDLVTNDKKLMTQTEEELRNLIDVSGRRDWFVNAYKRFDSYVSDGIKPDGVAGATSYWEVADRLYRALYGMTPDKRGNRWSRSWQMNRWETSPDVGTPAWRQRIMRERDDELPREEKTPFISGKGDIGAAAPMADTAVVEGKIWSAIKKHAPAAAAHAAVAAAAMWVSAASFNDGVPDAVRYTSMVSAGILAGAVNHVVRPAASALRAPLGAIAAGALSAVAVAASEEQNPALVRVRKALLEDPWDGVWIQKEPRRFQGLPDYYQFNADVGKAQLGVLADGITVMAAGAAAGLVIEGIGRGVDRLLEGKRRHAYDTLNRARVIRLQELRGGVSITTPEIEQLLRDRGRAHLVVMLKGAASLIRVQQEYMDALAASAPDLLVPYANDLELTRGYQDRIYRVLYGAPPYFFRDDGTPEMEWEQADRIDLYETQPGVGSVEWARARRLADDNRRPREEKTPFISGKGKIH